MSLTVALLAFADVVVLMVEACLLLTKPLARSMLQLISCTTSYPIDLERL